MAIDPSTPGLWPVALDGWPFAIDLLSDDGGFTSQSIPLLRTQADQGARPGEQSLNPDDLWRRSVESWHKGAGQSHADRSDSDPFRFRDSQHLNPWKKYELSLLPTTAVTTIAGATDPTLCVAANKMFYTDGVNVWHTDDVSSAGVLVFTLITGLPAYVAGVRTIASDGAQVYVTLGDFGDDVYVIDNTGAATIFYAAGTERLILVRCAKDRVLAFDDAGAVYDISAGAGPTAALFTHRLGSAWAWTDATDGIDFIFMSGYTGTGSEAHGAIYRVSLKADGTGLDVPIIAARLPDGEQALAVKGYLGVLLIGTSLGPRVSLEQTSGALRLGDLIETGPCYCFEPQASQVWFSWTGTATSLQDGGLGRIDLTGYDFTSGAPPYAADLFGGGPARTVVTFLGKRIYGDASTSLHAETITLHEQGKLLSGLFNFDLTSPKTFHFLHVKGEFSPVLAVTVYVDDIDASGATMGLARTNLDISSAQPDGGPTSESAIFDLTGWRADQLEYKLDVYTTINRVSLLARPALAARSEQINATLLVASTVTPNGEQDVSLDVFAAVQHVRSLVQKGSPVLFQAGAETYPVIVEDYRFIRMKGGVEGTGTWNGAVQVQMKRFDTVTPVFRGVRSDTFTADAAWSLTVPDGVLPGDVFYAAVVWNNPLVPVPTVAGGWQLLDSALDLDFGSATYKLVGTAAAFDVTFTTPVTALAVVLAYTQGADVATAFTVHESTPTEFAVINDFVNDAVAAIATTIAFQPSADFRVGAARSRARITAGDLVLDVGDALSSSSYSNETLLPGVAVIDALTGVVPVPETGEVRVWVDKLTT